MKPFFFLLLCSCFILSAYPVSAQQGVGKYREGFTQNGNVFRWTYDQADVQLEFCAHNMLRIRTSWSRQFEPNEPYMVVQYNWPAVKIDSKETNDWFELTTDELKVLVQKAPFGIRVLDKKGNLISASTGSHKNGADVSTRYQLAPDEHFFGFGERMDFLDRRGKKVTLNVGRGKGRPHIIGAYNVLEANYCPIPFFMSTRGYGIFLHSAYPTQWDMGSSETDAYTFGAAGGNMDYYIIYGPDFPAILDRYTHLTGKSPLMNRFAFGLHVGTYSGGTWGHEELTSTHYVVALAEKFRALGIPLDVLHLDSTWRIFGDVGGKGATSFEWRETFHNPKAMFDSLYALHINMVGVHLRPRFDNGKTLKLLDEARKKRFVYPEEDNPGEFVNFFDPKAVDWWWENGVMRVASQGAMFLKTDEGSAFGALANESDKVGPTGDEIKRLHNLFPLVYAKAPYEKFAKYNGLRGMNHTREGYAGIQRYPFIFAGDWPSEWQYFGPMIKAGLNIGLSGVGYWAHCMGGFEHEADPELYIRWCQFGLLSPVAHLFGMDHPGYKEPWNYGDEGLRIFKQYDQLRYRLIPYLYTQAWTQYKTGMPLMRALVLQYQNDVNTYDISDQYMLGESMLICPVTTKGAQTRALYLPEGKWYSHWTGEVYQGKQYLQVVTPLDQMPIFYKAGSIIPTQPDVQYIDKTLPAQITLDIYPADTASFTLYEDDGRSEDYKNGVYAMTTIRYDEKSGDASITIEPANGSYTLPDRTYTIQLHTAAQPKEVKLQGAKKKQQPGWTYNAEKSILTVSISRKPQDRTQIIIKQ